MVFLTSNSKLAQISKRNEKQCRGFKKACGGIVRQRLAYRGIGFSSMSHNLQSTVMIHNAFFFLPEHHVFPPWNSCRYAPSSYAVLHVLSASDRNLSHRKPQQTPTTVIPSPLSRRNPEESSLAPVELHHRIVSSISPACLDLSNAALPP